MGVLSPGVRTRNVNGNNKGLSVKILSPEGIQNINNVQEYSPRSQKIIENRKNQEKIHAPISEEERLPYIDMNNLEFDKLYDGGPTGENTAEDGDVNRLDVDVV